MSDETPKLRGLETVRVSKTKLLEKVKANREEHRATFEEAIAGWRDEIVRRVEEILRDAKAGRDVPLHIGVVRPEDHTSDYDSVISLLEMSEDDELELTYQQFNQYANDNWGWQHQFLATASTYGSETALNKLGINNS
jgi:hypothetical protein